MIDQVTRDGFSQLLIAKYLERKGATVIICNQQTFIGMFERYKPDVVYASWMVGGPVMEFLLQNQYRTRIALMDQEGGRIGEEPFKRSFKFMNGIKTKIGRLCDKVFVWGPAQDHWLKKMDILDRDSIIVTGSPRFDPYLVQSQHLGNKYLGITLRGDPITSAPTRFMETVYHFSNFDSRFGIGVGYPTESQYEDKIWHIVASTRYLFKVATEFSKCNQAPLVFRPGPWEQEKQYQFILSKLASSSIEPTMLQHNYVRNAFALLDESSSLGQEGLLADVPVISVQRLIPRIEQHILGEGGGLYTAPYLECYWRPKSVDEAVDLLKLAKKGGLASSPCPQEFQIYLKDYHLWPRKKPSSFCIGDEILDLLDLGPRKKISKSQKIEISKEGSGKDRIKLHPANSEKGIEFDNKIVAKTISGRFLPIFRHIPGSTWLLKGKYLSQQFLSHEKELLRRYHYYESLYPHKKEVDSVFESLWKAYEFSSK